MFLVSTDKLVTKNSSANSRSADTSRSKSSPSAFHDAHVHLFNGSDLPVVGFTRYVVLPGMLPGWSELIAVFTDIMFRVVKPHALTIAEERRLLGLGGRHADRSDLTIATAAQRIAEHINSGLEQIDRSRGRISLADFQLALSEEEASLLLLAKILASPELIGAEPTARADARAYKVAPATIQLLLEGRLVEWSDESFIPGEALVETKTDRRLSLRDLQQTFVWIGRMFHGRLRHLREYAREMRDDAFSPQHIINLLVDFDEWLRLPWNNDLADGPSPDSSHHHQIEFWRDFASKKPHGIEVHTFAGYDPLKHAKELFPRGADPEAPPKTSSYFRSLSEYALKGAIRGFKLYPPMGFRAFGNKDLDRPCNRDFVGANGVGASVVKSWGERPPLGPSLDNALGQMYELASREDLPILLHSGATNLTASNFSERTSQEHLLKALDKFPKLRVCIAHFTEAQPFITEMQHIQDDGGSLQDSKLDALRHASRMFTTRTPNVFADIGHMEEFLWGDENLPARFFCALFDYFRKAPGAVDRIMFGSDWIMLARQPGYRNYVRIINDGLEAALRVGDNERYADFRDKFFRTNFLDFLKLS